MIPIQQSGSGAVNEEGKGLLYGRHVLVADDSPAIRYVAASALRSQGAIVQETSDGRQAIALVTSGNFDLVLMDVQMPRIDGLDATRKLRAEGFNKLPILALTASSAAEHQDCLAAGMDDVIQKPFTRASLISQVLHCLEEAGGAGDSAASSIFSIEALESLCGGDTAFMKRLLGIAVQELPFAANQMRFAYDNGDMEHVARVAHRVRPCVEGLRITALPEKLLEIEDLSASKTDNIRLSQLINSVANELEKIARQIIKE
jgi:CheY-like chemotaxis protein